jgi:hypothetical protein
MLGQQRTVQRALSTRLELLQEINPQTDPRRRCPHPLSHGRPEPISQKSKACPDAASCAFGDEVMVFALPWPRPFYSQLRRVRVGFAPNASWSYRFILRGWFGRMGLYERIFVFKGKRRVDIKKVVKCTCDENVLNTRSTPGMQGVLVIENVAARLVQINGPRHCGDDASTKIEMRIT